MPAHWPLYCICPFGGILCIECGTPIPSDSRTDFVKAVQRHTARKHVGSEIYNLELADRRIIYDSFVLGFSKLASFLAKCNEEQLLVELSNYLSMPPLSYPYCSHKECEMPIQCKSNHLQRAHKQYITKDALGCLTTTWKTNIPVVIPYPLLASKLEKYLHPMFWNLFQAAKIEAAANLPPAAPEQALLVQPPLPAIPLLPPADPDPDPDPDPLLQVVWHQYSTRIATARADLIAIYSQSQQPNLWLKQVGWARHLQGLSTTALFNLTLPVEQTEVSLTAILESVDRVLNSAYTVAN
jgi:hypothetical protein